MTAQKARQITQDHSEVIQAIATLETLVQISAERGACGTKSDVKRSIIHHVRDHFAANGFNINVTSSCGVYTLHLGW